MYYTYILKCSDGSLYCGYTNNPEKKVATHNKGKGAKYTKTRLPVELVYLESFFEKSDALKRECEIKNLKRSEKLKLLKEE